MVKTIVSKTKAQKKYMDLREIKAEMTDFMNVGVKERESRMAWTMDGWMVVSFIEKEYG